MLWLYSNTLGTILLGLHTMTKGDLGFVMAPLVGFFAAGISLPIIALNVPIMRKIVAQPTSSIRLCCAFLAVTGLFVTALGGVIVINQEYQLPAATIATLTLPFYPAALLATWLEYRPWLLSNLKR